MDIQHVTDFKSNRNDHIVNAANILKKSELKQKVFAAVYFHKSKIKTISYIEKKLTLTECKYYKTQVILLKNC